MEYNDIPEDILTAKTKVAGGGELQVNTETEKQRRKRERVAKRHERRRERQKEQEILDKLNKKRYGVGTVIVSTLFQVIMIVLTLFGTKGLLSVREFIAMTFARMGESTTYRIVSPIPEWCAYIIPIILLALLIFGIIKKRPYIFWISLIITILHVMYWNSCMRVAPMLHGILSD